MEHDSFVAQHDNAPSLVLFWVWDDASTADRDLMGTSGAVKNGYSELRAKLHRTGFYFVVVRWHCELQFAMWIVVPAAHVNGLKDDIDLHCGLLTDHLTRNGYAPSLDRPSVEID